MSKESPAVKKAKRSVSISFNETSEYDPETQKALEELDLCQTEMDALNEKANDEILKVEQKYNKLRKPHLDKREDLVSKIPSFWINTLIGNPQVSPIICEEEEECLQHLTALILEESDDIKSGYKIRLQFRDNPFFDKTELIKEFQLAEDTGEAVSTSTQIQWKAGKNLVQKFANDRKAKGNKRSNLPDRTFFEWFLDNSEPSCDEIAETIKDEIWPNPLQFFLAADDDVLNRGEEEDEDELSDEEENGEEDEDDEFDGEDGEEGSGDE